jgi:hypothetical protein
MKTRNLLLLLSLAGSVAGCRSRVVQVTLINASNQPLSTIVVDYPRATFGVNQLEPGKAFRYRIKPQDTGPLKIEFADAAGHDHTYIYPGLHKNDEGTIVVQLTQTSATASVNTSQR